MKDLKKHSTTELLQLINQYKKKHEEKKQEIYDELDLIKEIDQRIDEKVKELENIEKNQIDLLKEYTSREE